MPNEVLKQTLRQIASDTAEVKAAVRGSLADIAASWCLSQYMPALHAQLDSLPDGPERMKILRQAANDFAAFQGRSQDAARLVIERERLNFERLRLDCATDKAFWKRTKLRKIRRKLRPPKRKNWHISQASRRKIKQILNWP